MGAVCDAAARFLLHRLLDRHAAEMWRIWSHQISGMADCIPQYVCSSIICQQGDAELGQKIINNNIKLVLRCRLPVSWLDSDNQQYS